MLLTYSKGWSQANEKNIQQNKDTVVKRSESIRKTITAPLILAGAGLLTFQNREFFLSRYEVREVRNERLTFFQNHVDDYLQYGPIPAVYGLSALGIKGKNDFANKTVLMIKSEVIMAALTCSLKKTDCSATA